MAAGADRQSGVDHQQHDRRRRQRAIRRDQRRGHRADQIRALQVAAENISINAIATCAFDIPNDVFMRWVEDHHATRDEAAEWVPIKRLGRPQEIAAATLYLASDEARFVVGHVLTVDGGFTAQ
ncbi:SDR family oxidoreductase [Hoeflea sp. CAU 1731]